MLKIDLDEIQNLHFAQGALPSCQFLSALFALSRHPAGALLLAEMVQTEEDEGAKKAAKNTVYQVTFPRFPQHPVTVSSRLIKTASWSLSLEDVQQFYQVLEHLQRLPGERYLKWIPVEREFSVKGSLFARLMEQAYAGLMMQQYPGQYPHVGEENLLEVYRAADQYHYHPGVVLRDLTGWEGGTYIANGGAAFEISGSFVEEGQHTPSVLVNIRQFLEELAADPEGKVVVASSIGEPGPFCRCLDPGQKVMGWHDHSLLNVNAQEETIHLVDPLNTRIGLLLSYTDFFQYFNGVSWVKVP